MRGLFLPSFASHDYTLHEKIDLWRGKRFSQRSGLWDLMQATDVAAT